MYILFLFLQPPQQPPPLHPSQTTPSHQPHHSLSSFQSNTSLNGSRTNLTSTKAVLEPAIYHRANIHYQPEVIRIERAPSVSSMVRPPSCSPSPPPPPPPNTLLVAADVSSNGGGGGGVPPGMPAPMAPLSFQRYQPTFQYPQPPSWNNNGYGNGVIQGSNHHGHHAGPRSFDDVDIALSHRNPDRILMHQHSASNLTASGGTLPRLGKGFVQNKPRPVAKIVAKTREQPTSLITHHHSSNSLSDLDPKMIQHQQHQLMLMKQHNGAGIDGKTSSDSQVCIYTYYYYQLVMDRVITKKWVRDVQ